MTTHLASGRGQNSLRELSLSFPTATSLNVWIYRKDTRESPCAQAIRSALELFEAGALFDGTDAWDRDDLESESQNASLKADDTYLPGRGRYRQLPGRPERLCGSEWLYPECGTYRRKPLEDLFGAAGMVWRELDYRIRPA